MDPLLSDGPERLRIAMACGTPVVALRRGAVPEIVVPGRTGFIVDHASELPAVIIQARSLNPTACREHVETHFTVQGMAAGYEAAYRRVLAEVAEPSSSDRLAARHHS